MSKWKKISLGEVALITRGASPRPIHDWMTKDDKEGIPWLKISDATYSISRFIQKTREYIKKDAEKKSVVVEKGDLIVSNSATPGLPKIMAISACIHDGWLLFRNLKDIDRDFLYYLLINERERIVSQGSGTIFTNLKTEILKKYQIKLPSISEQKKISSFFNLIDDKIDLNEEQNLNIEEIISSLFKSWFINLNLKKIPKGWKNGSLNDLIIRSKAKINENTNKILTAVKTGNLILSNEYFSKKVYSKKTDNYLKVDKYDFAYNPSRINIGSIGMNKYDFTGAVSPIYIVFKTKNSWHWFLEEFLKLKSTKDNINQLSSGSVRQSLSFDDFASLKIIIPNEEVIIEFNSIIESLKKKINQNIKNTSTLLNLKNILLPSILSEKIHISETN